MTACSQGHPLLPEAQFCSKCGEAVDGLAKPIAHPAPAASDVEAQSRRGPRLPVLLLGGLALLGLIATIFYFVAAGRETQLRGVAVLFDSGEDPAITGSWDECEGTGGYSDFGAGMNISLTDREGDIVGTGSVENITEARLTEIVEMDRIATDAGNVLIGIDATDRTAAEDELRSLLKLTEGTTCMLYFSAEVEESDYYSVELASRGALDYSMQEMTESAWILSISLGD